MISLRMEVLDKEAVRPTGNPFQVKPVSVREAGPTMIEVGTGIRITLPTELELRVLPLASDVHCLNYSFAQNEELRLLLQKDGIFVNRNESIAIVYVVERTIAPVRFVETIAGKRAITGPAMEISEGE